MSHETDHRPTATTASLDGRRTARMPRLPRGRHRGTDGLAGVVSDMPRGRRRPAGCGGECPLAVPHSTGMVMCYDAPSPRGTTAVVHDRGLPDSPAYTAQCRTRGGRQRSGGGSPVQFRPGADEHIRMRSPASSSVGRAVVQMPGVATRGCVAIRQRRAGGSAGTRHGCMRSERHSECGGPSSVVCGRSNRQRWHPQVTRWH